MRFERMVIEAGSNTFTLIVHPRLTVIAGVGQVERDALVGELLGALGPSRAGVHVELVQDDGRRLAVFRPHGGRHRVVDVDRAADVTAEFADADGKLDLLLREQLDTRKSRRYLRLTRTDLAATAQSDLLVRRLAQVDQTELWSAAARVRVTDDELSKEAEAAGSAPEDAEVVQQVEERHRAFEAAVRLNERLRKSAAIVAGFAFLSGIIVAVLDRIDSFPAVFLMALALVIFVGSLLFQRRVDHAASEEQEALNAAGAESYLGFHLQRVNGMLSDSTSRRRLMQAAEDHREAAARWTELAGDVSVDWALEHHEEIAAAAKLRRDVAQLGSVGDEPADDLTTDLAHALVGRMARARTIGKSSESFPLLLDDPFVGLAANTKATLCELLARTAGSPQVILLTDDDDVAGWARMEALTGTLSILEPMPESDHTTLDA